MKTGFIGIMMIKRASMQKIKIFKKIQSGASFKHVETISTMNSNY